MRDVLCLARDSQRDRRRSRSQGTPHRARVSVRRCAIGGPERDVLETAALDHPRGALPARVGVDQQRDHHRRIVRRPAVSVGADSRHRTPTDPSPRPPRSQTARSDPPAATHPNSAATKRLPAIAPQEVPRHDRIVLNPSHDPRFTQQPAWNAAVAPGRLLPRVRRKEQRVGATRPRNRGVQSHGMRECGLSSSVRVSRSACSSPGGLGAASRRGAGAPE
jgi:hypothetical protein